MILSNPWDPNRWRQWDLLKTLWLVVHDAYSVLLGTEDRLPDNSCREYRDCVCGTGGVLGFRELESDRCFVALTRDGLCGSRAGCFQAA